MRTPRAFEFMPEILNFLRDRRDHSARPDIQRWTEKRVVQNRGLTPRPQALGWALTYLVRKGLIERPNRGVYKILSKGQLPFDEADGKRITKEYERPTARRTK